MFYATQYPENSFARSVQMDWARRYLAIALRTVDAERALVAHCHAMRCYPYPDFWRVV